MTSALQLKAADILPAWTAGRELYIQMAITGGILIISTFILTAVLMHFILPVLVEKKVGQSIRDEGPEWHKIKAGTPTMGGISFIIAILISILVLLSVWIFRGEQFNTVPMALTIAFAVANGMIGFIDDYRKLVKKQNEGLTEKEKLILQVLASAAYLLAMALTGNLATSFVIPFTSYTLELSHFAYVVYFLVMIGFVNGTNFTDGLDGLLSSVTAAVAAFMIILSFVGYMSPETSAVMSAVMGGMFGFLLYNRHPARVFMGDTGSLFIGGIIMGCAIADGQMLPILIAGFVYVFEMLSSFIQKFYFKATHGKRFFKMAPFHHHLEKCGMGEVAIVLTFVIATIVLSGIAYLGLYLPTLY